MFLFSSFPLYLATLLLGASPPGRGTIIPLILKASRQNPLRYAFAKVGAFLKLWYFVTPGTRVVNWDAEAHS